MNKIFYGTLISYAKGELQNIDHLLIRVERKFLVEQSIDQAIISIKKIEKQLIEAKKSYTSMYASSK
jgi:prefoldin subunit 5